MKDNNGSDVAVLGCGLMGSAIVTALASSGRDVVAWNRSPQKAHVLVGERVRTAESLAGMSTVAVLISCLSTYQALAEVLGALPDLPGSTLVNLTTGDPREAEEMRTRAEAQGLTYLDGAILAYPADIGTAECQILIAGASEVWNQHANLLRALGGKTFHVAERIGAANVLDVGLVGAYHISALAAFAESAAYVLDNGVSVDALVQVARPLVELQRQVVTKGAMEIALGDYTTDQATLSVYAAAARMFVDAIRRDGHPARMLGAASASLDVAEAAGHGASSIFAVRQRAHEER